MDLIKRDAKLFVAGYYADKGGDYPVAKLQRWCENAQGKTVPFNVVHGDVTINPLDGLGEHGMGFFSGFNVRGDELWAQLYCPKLMSDLIDKTGHKGLSVGVQGDNIREISWVKVPRVEDATIFHGDVEYAFSGQLESAEEITTPMPNTNPISPKPPEKAPEPQPDNKQDFAAATARADAAEKRLQELEQKVSKDNSEFAAQLRLKDDEAKVDRLLVATGKILEAEKPLFLAFSALEAPITFAAGDETKELRPFDALMEFMQAHDPELIVQTRMARGTKVVSPDDDSPLIAEASAVFSAQGEARGLKDDELKKFIDKNVEAYRRNI